MGTRAAFFIGDPCDLNNREYIGSFHWDGYPDAVIEDLQIPTEGAIESAEVFIQRLARVATRHDWAPASGGFPYPWADDLFLTDCVYAFFDSKVWYTDGYHDWIEFNEDVEERLAIIYESDEDRPTGRLDKFADVPSPGEYDGKMAGMIVVTA